MRYRLIDNSTGEGREITRLDAHKWALANGHIFRQLEASARKSYYPTTAEGTTEKMEIHDNE